MRLPKSLSTIFSFTFFVLFVLIHGTQAICMENPAVAASAKSPTNSTPLSWPTLSEEQKIALAPLAKEWGEMGDLQRKKWLSVADKYASMKPEEKQRVQERVAAWVKLTPEQRKAARENFTNMPKTSPEKKSAQWHQYQQLSPEEKQRLAKDAKNQKPVTAIPPESKRSGIVLAPLKKGPPPTSENSSASQPITK